MGVSLWMRAFIYGILFGRLGGCFHFAGELPKAGYSDSGKMAQWRG
jgi:hypothetical protein